MKSILLCAILLISSFASAQNLTSTFPKDAVGVSQANGSVISVEEICPLDAPCPPDAFTHVELLVYLGGCVDVIGNVSYEFDKASDTLYVSVIQVHREMSRSVKCFVANTQKVELDVDGLHGNLKVVFVGGFGGNATGLGGGAGNGMGNGPMIHPTQN